MTRSAAFDTAALAAAALMCLVPLLVPAPAGLEPAAWRVLGITLAMALLWITEALPLAATALVPLAVFPLFGVQGIGAVAGAYAHPLIILFLGGFLIARAIEAHGLHRRLALSAAGLFGGRPAGTVGAIMAGTAFLSLWISNTATTMIMAPIGAAIAATRPGDARLGAAMMLGIAFAATIGGMGSLIGTPPNALFAAYMAETHGRVIGFAEWAMFGLPTSLILLPIAWGLLTRVFFRPDPATLAVAHERLAPMEAPERRVAVIVTLTALAWITRPLAERWVPGLSDAGIAMAAALALFALPGGDGRRLLDWERAKDLRWDVLILFGGGLALAGAIDATGLANWIAGGAGVLAGLPMLAIVGLSALMVVALGELASNTAMAAIFLPVAGATAIGLGVDPLLFTIPVALAASIGFMLPVATPPNAIVFANPAVTRERMLVAGAPLDVIGTVVAVGVASLIAPLVFGG